MKPSNKPAVEARLSRWRQVITNACTMLQLIRSGPARFGGDSYATNADCYILLTDATRHFCECVCEQFGELPGKRWSAVLPELLVAHPARCRETLALVERREFKELSYFQFDAA